MYNEVIFWARTSLFRNPLKITHSILNNFLKTPPKKLPFVFEIWLSAHSHVFLSFYPSHFRSNGKLPSFRGWGQPLTSGRISVWWIGLCPPMIWRTFLDSIRTIGCIYHLSKADLGVVITRITHLRLRQFNISLFSLLKYNICQFEIWMISMMHENKLSTTYKN